MVNNLLLAASKSGIKLGLVPVALVDLLQNTVGLTTNANSETYAPVNQVTLPGDGKRYDLKPDVRKVKSISARFRYTPSTANLSAFYFVHHPAGGSAYTAVGAYDEWNGQAGFKLVDDTHTAATAVTSNFDGVLKRTFVEPIPISEIYVKVGGRSGYGYSPIYVKDLVIEFV